MRLFKTIWFAGNGEFSRAEAELLHKILEGALTSLGGSQQPGHSTNEEQAKEEEKFQNISKHEIEEAARDIVIALTGKEFEFRK